MEKYIGAISREAFPLCLSKVENHRYIKTLNKDSVRREKPLDVIGHPSTA